jgi:legumain
LCLAALFAAVAAQQGQNWAVLVAGSNGYYNYRHQSDICHAYQILRKNGIPDSNIIVFMYDDIANNSQNPKKGTIVNCSGCGDVYKGVPKDYTGKLVTPKNFLDVLSGKDMSIGSKKSLKSGPNDNVFIYFSDHGGPGLIAFPDEYLYATDLIKSLNAMSQGKKYKQLVFYMEACEAGSMFNNVLASNLNIYATTASNPFQSSYACDYNSTYQAYLNDCYSINFLLNTEQNNVRTYTLQQQYSAIKQQTTQSPVCQYGDLTIASQPVGNFMAAKQTSYLDYARKTMDKQLKAPKNMVDSRDVKLAHLQKRVLIAKTEAEKKVAIDELEQHHKEQRRADVIWHSFAMRLGLENYSVLKQNDVDHCYSQKAMDFDCIKESVEAAVKICGKFDESSLKYTEYIRNACNAGYTAKDMAAQLNQICAFANKI